MIELYDPFAPVALPSDDVLALLRAIHPSSDLVRLFRMSEDALKYTLLIARDVYNEGRALRPHNGPHAPHREDLVREVLELRSRFGAMAPRERAALRVAEQKVSKGILCSSS